MSQVRSEEQKDNVGVSKAAREKSMVVVFTGAGSLDKMEINEEIVAEPKDNEIRVKIKFIGVNFIDILKKLGVYSQSIMGDSFPVVPGNEASGIVDAVGSKVNSRESNSLGKKNEFQIGERVILFANGGLYRDTICINSRHAFKIPENMSLEQASCVAMSYLTAYDMLFKMCRLKAGDIVLMPQAAGGVGMAVIQLCRTVPDVKLIAVCSAAKHDLLKSMGVDHCFDYQTEKYVDEVRKISSGGVDIIFDGLNGSDSVAFFDLLRPFGKVVHYGIANMTSGGGGFLKKATTYFKGLKMDSAKIIMTNRSMSGYHLGALTENNVEQMLDSFTKVLKLYADGVHQQISTDGLLDEIC